MAIEVSELPSLDAQATAAYAHLFQALSEPTRLAVVQHLASGEHRVRDLVEHMGLAQSTVSKHLSFLVECHLIQARPEGRATWYSLTRPHELAALIAAAEHILHATGTDAVLCAHLRHPPQGPATGTAAARGGAAASSGREAV
ncbi:ArsR/SmtB family transcription factor [Kocuria marina]|uniref:ArsR/SmtB family transcription factor n=1 Tax=Kocuria marina TaxID=223184 RepID=UPI003F29E8E3